MKGGILSIPPPVGGWNARDSLDEMKASDAVFLDNFWPEDGKVSLRKGYESHATGMTSAVETVASFSSGSSDKLLAASNGNIWDATSAGAAVSLGSGFTSNKWQTANMDAKIALVNGVNTPQQYNGTALSNLTVTGSGLTAASIIGVHVFKGRSYFWMDSDQSFYYSALNALGGACTEFDLSRVGSRGGKLMMMGTWSRDAGSGMDDLAVFVMSSGEVIVYQGSNPGDATDWSLVGVYMTGHPISRRGLVKLGGELIIVTRDGFMPMSAILQKSDFIKNDSFSDKIRGAVTASAIAYGSNFGWDAAYSSPGSKLIFNIPITEGSESYQYVQNTVTGAWCRFKNIPALCWCQHGTSLYFGGPSGVVYHMDTGYSDNGSNIEADALPAYNYMGKRGAIKSFTGVKHILSTDGSLEYETRLGTDFRQPDLTYESSLYLFTGSEWDVATWNDDYWAGSGDDLVDVWKSVDGIGYNCSARLRISTQDRRVQWFSTNYLFKIGGGI